MTSAALTSVPLCVFAADVDSIADSALLCVLAEDNKRTAEQWQSCDCIRSTTDLSFQSTATLCLWNAAVRSPVYHNIAKLPHNPPHPCWKKMIILTWCGGYDDDDKHLQWVENKWEQKGLWWFVCFCVCVCVCVWEREIWPCFSMLIFSSN